MRAAADAITLCCPTRNRPGNVRRMLSSALETAAHPDLVEAVFRADDDAPGSVPPDVADRERVTVITGPRAVLSGLWTECARVADGTILMQCDDEAVFRSEGWDDLVREAFASVPDRILFAHGGDGHQPPEFGALGFVSREWADVVGYFTPPYFSCDYGDTWLNDVANMLGRRRYIPGVLIEHLHPVAGKAAWDETHLQRLARGRDDDVASLYASKAAEREADTEKLRKAMIT